MKFGLFTCGYQRLSLERAFADAARFGYDYVELWGGYPHAYVPDLKAKGTEEIRALIEKYQMPVRCFTPEHNAYPFNYMTGDEDQWNRCMDYLEQAIDITAEIGATYMLFSAGHAGCLMTQDQIDDRLRKSLKRLAAYAEKKAVKLILEPLTVYESNVVTNLNALERALGWETSPSLVGMTDLAVPFTNGESAADYVRRLGSRFDYLHVIDNDGVSESHILPGDGCMPLKEILHDIQDAGFDGHATIELVTNYLKEPSIYAKMAIERVRAMMGD